MNFNSKNKIIIYGPQGSGKTYNSSLIANRLKADCIIDEASFEEIQGESPDVRTLYLTNDPQALNLGAEHLNDVLGKINRKTIV